jgi:hypothetical protein
MRRFAERFNQKEEKGEKKKEKKKKKKKKKNGKSCFSQPITWNDVSMVPQAKDEEKEQRTSTKEKEDCSKKHKSVLKLTKVRSRLAMVMERTLFLSKKVIADRRNIWFVSAI